MPHSRWFRPDCWLPSFTGTIFLPSSSTGIGPTDFAETSEYVTILFFFASIVTLSLKRPAFEFGAFWALVASLTLSGLSELALAFHTKFFWPTNEAGLFLRLIAVYLMYRVFLKAGIFAPFNLIFRNLSLSEKNLFSLIEGLPAFVFVQMPDYTIRYANRVFRDLFGNPEGLTCYEILTGNNDTVREMPHQGDISDRRTATKGLGPYKG